MLTLPFEYCVPVCLHFSHQEGPGKLSEFSGSTEKRKTGLYGAIYTSQEYFFHSCGGFEACLTWISLH